MGTRISKLLSLVLLLMLLGSPFLTQKVYASGSEFTFDSETLKVDINIFEPCVMKTEGGYDGFDIELWEAIAKEAELKFTYNEVEFKQIFENLKKEKADVGLAGITINEKREKTIDFSHPYLNSGLSILVKSNGKATILSTIKAIFTPGLKKVLWILLIFIIVVGHIAWLSERGKNSINDNYFPGIFEAIYWAIVTVTTVGYGDIVPQKWCGRIVTSIVILVGLAIFGMYVGEVSSSMTLQKLESDIQSYTDLRGKKVGTVENTTSIDTLKSIGAKVVQVKQDL